MLSQGLAGCARLDVFAGGGGLPRVSLAKEADYRLCVFAQVKTKPGGVFREKNFFILSFSFVLGITILKSIFDFG